MLLDPCWVCLSCWGVVQTLHDERFLLVVKTTPPQHGETATSGVAAVPVIPEITLMLVSGTAFVFWQPAV